MKRAAQDLEVEVDHEIDQEVSIYRYTRGDITQHHLYYHHHNLAFPIAAYNNLQGKRRNYSDENSKDAKDTRSEQSDTSTLLSGRVRGSCIACRH